MAKRVLREGPADNPGRIDYATRLAICRKPDPVERERLSRLLAAEVDANSRRPSW